MGIELLLCTGCYWCLSCGIPWWEGAGLRFPVAVTPQLPVPRSRYMSRPVMSGPGLYDPTTIMNADILAYCQKEGWCKLAFYLLSFFYYLYG